MTSTRIDRLAPERQGMGRRLRDGHPSPGSVALTLAGGYAVLSLLLIGAGLLLTHVLTPVGHWDDHVNSWLAARRTRGWNTISDIGTFIANTLGVAVVCVAVTAFALLRRWGRTAALVLCGLALELATFLTVNYIVARPRPSAPHLGSTPSTYSFPSGHVAATFVLYGGIAVIVGSRTRVPWARLAALLIAAVLVAWVAFSRVYEAEHHPTDVLAGLLLGIGALSTAVAAVRPPHPDGGARWGHAVAAPVDERVPVNSADASQPIGQEALR